jgi:hypothetical protein
LINVHPVVFDPGSRAMAPVNCIDIYTLVRFTSDVINSWSSVIRSIVMHIGVIDNHCILDINPVSVPIVSWITVVVDIGIWNKAPAHIWYTISTSSNVNADRN